MYSLPDFNLGDLVVNDTITDYDFPYDRIISYGEIVGYYYKDCSDTSDMPDDFIGWVYHVKVTKASPKINECYITTFKGEELQSLNQFQLIKHYHEV